MTTTTDDRFTPDKAQGYRDEAKAARQRSADSWDRSDTDGFLSQWASDITAREYDLKADLAEANGRWQFYGVFTPSGELTDFRQVETRYGYSWVRGHSHDGTSEWFNPSNAKKGARRLAADTAKGYVMGYFEADGHVELRGSQTSCSAVVIENKDSHRTPVSWGEASGDYADREW